LYNNIRGKKMIIYKAVVQYYGHPYLSGQHVEGNKIYRDGAGMLWLLYSEQSEESEWVLIDESTLEEIEVG
jgi:hypothetical protein